ncbi:hypothetical protein L596_006337 [Steinernema carpocapsae]|uniref:Uncharacterized protein n=1 Tax=Steinernema carpocapsae TaxID=34508 RepID=A0A4U8V1R7_STECR|nr:hypothetical protein L596_006337 [Steinernema carpocapsae]
MLPKNSFCKRLPFSIRIYWRVRIGFLAKTVANTVDYGSQNHHDPLFEDLIFRDLHTPVCLKRFTEVGNDNLKAVCDRKSFTAFGNVAINLKSKTYHLSRTYREIQRCCLLLSTEVFS